MATDTRQKLLARPDIPDEDVDDIIAAAQALQDAERADDGTATVAEVQAVAAELDIDPKHVEEAIRQRRASREQAEVEARQAEAEAQARTDRTRSLVQRLALGALALGLLAVVLGFGTAQVGANALGSARANVELARGKLDAALDRQAALAPQLVALAGAEATPVKQAADVARAAESIDARLDAAGELNQAMAEALGDVTANGDDQAQQRLLNLQYEVVGTWNRIDTERARYQEARTRWDQTADSFSGGLALTLGVAEEL